MNRVFAVLLGCGLALASVAAAPPPAKAPVAAAKPVPAKPLPPAKPMPPDDPAKVAAAREFIQLYHPRMNLGTVKKMLDKFIPTSIERRKKKDPKFDAKAYEADLRQRVMKGSAEKLELQARVVSRHFSLQELQALIAFCKSPLGKKLVDETSKIQRDMLMARRQAGLNLPGASLYAQDKDKDDEDEDEDDAPVKKPAPKPPVLKPQPKK